jgi:cytoplasmic iron level regulating protein YaaA (DUF328/UPF0246 family)
MLILLPPSEGKTPPPTGPPLDLGALAFPELAPTRERIANALVTLCRRPATAREVLGLGPAQAEDLGRDARLWSEPTAPAIEVYSGVLYDALDAATLTRPARHRLARRVVIASALFGLVSPEDAIPAYRLSGTARLPKVGPVAAAWRPAVTSALADVTGLVLDLRSSAYVALGSAPSGHVPVRVLTESAGRITVVSHGNKATKGILVRRIVGTDARVLDDVIDLCHAEGWTAQRTGPGLDIVVPAP